MRVEISLSFTVAPTTSWGPVDDDEKKEEDDDEDSDNDDDDSTKRTFSS